MPRWGAADAIERVALGLVFFASVGVWFYLAAFVWEIEKEFAIPLIVPVALAVVCVVSALVALWRALWFARDKRTTKLS